MDWTTTGLIWVWAWGVRLSEIAVFNNHKDSFEKKLNYIAAILWPISIPILVLIGKIRAMLR